MAYLTDQQVIDACSDSIPIFLSNDFYAHMVFNMLHDFGFRYEEVFNVTRWSVKNELYYNMQSAKGGNVREILKTDIQSEYRTYIQNSKPNVASLKRDTAFRLFARYFPIQNIYVEDHPVKTHIYRYSKCKYMYIQEYTYQEIADYLGEVDVQNIASYVEATLYTP